VPFAPPRLMLIRAGFSQRLSDHLPPVYQKQLPRLNKKMALFVTRSTLVQRRDDLDLWVRRLFDIPQVRSSRMLCDFFERDVASASRQRDATVRPAHASRPSLSHSRRNTNERMTPDLFAKHPLQAPHLAAPHLGHKRSTPNLRYHPDDLEHDLPPTPTYAIGPENEEAAGDAFHHAAFQPSFPRRRPSLDSVARSVSTEHTITPSLLASTCTVTPDESPFPSPQTPHKALRPKATLRHFISLQDIVSPFFAQILNLPDPSIKRQHITPHPAVPNPPAQGLAQGLTRSRSSSGASDSHFAPSLPNTPISASVAGRFPIESQRSRRPSTKSVNDPRSRLPYRSHMHTDSGGSLHSHSQSASSISSADTLDTSSSSLPQWGHDGDSSKDSLSSSPMSFAQPATPPTPHWQEPTYSPKGLMIDHDPMAYSAFSTNLVPLPNNMTFGSPRGMGPRSRSGSVATNGGRSFLEPIMGSPSLSGGPSTPSSPLTPMTPSSAASFSAISPRELVTLKVRHAQANVVLRIERSASLNSVKRKIAEKLKSNGIAMLPEYDLFLVLKQDPEADPATFLLEADESWKQAAGSCSKLVLQC
jgi:hypothetical protein